MITSPRSISRPVSRRAFLRQSGAVVASAAALSSAATGVFAAGAGRLRVGLIGCGGRGTGAVTQVLRASPDQPIVLWAMADLFRDRLEASYQMLAGGAEGRYDRDSFRTFAPQLEVPPERRFVGFDAFRQLLETEVDLVILATPPGFRPRHFEAAVRAGKHVFMEKPVAVDPAGVRIVIQAAREARQKGLSVAAGTQRRHQKHYVEIIQRIHDGAIGEIVSAACYWNSAGKLYAEPKPPGMSDMEWQCRTWYPHCWLSGDHIVEQHVHNIDVINWALRAHPVSAAGQGGRQVRQGGDIWDHFAIEYEYPGGIRAASYCRQIPGCSDRVSERIVGTRGLAQLDGSSGFIQGPQAFRSARSPNPYLQEHIDLIRSIRQGEALNEGLAVAESSLTAIIGRMSAYTGQNVGWDWALNESRLDLMPARLEFKDLPPLVIPTPGRTPLA